jgi:transcriptional regulator with XRE-family HTH domain
MLEDSVSGDQRLLMKTLATQMRQQGLTQERAAEALGVSTPTLKRWLAGDGVSLEAVLRIMSLLEVSWEDISAVMISHNERLFTYTRKQELHFVRSPSTLAVFDLLLRGAIPAQILQRSGVSSPSINRYLADLEKLGLIERGVRGKISIIPKGEPQWIAGGPLQLAFLEEALVHFLSKDVLPAQSFGIYELLPEDVSDVEIRLSGLKKRLSYLHRKAKFHKSQTKEKFGFLAKFAPFAWKRLVTGSQAQRLQNLRS